tara:strand:+ start:307 stop:1089 length:783 start_codon:yes stop_codon:yes gene_type:complete
MDNYTEINFTGGGCLGEPSQVIGFAEKYYTLWEVYPCARVVYSSDGPMAREGTQYNYIQNLSMDLEKAESKLEGDYKIDLYLRGGRSFWKARQVFEAKADEFSFGLLKGQKISDSDDVWQLERAMVEEESQDKKDLAFNRLQGLDIYVVTFRGKYMTAKDRDELLIKEHIDNLKAGHHFNDGDKVELEIKELDRFGFDGYYGWTAIVEYESKDGKLFKYMGGSPKRSDDFEEFTKVTATVKHSDYKGENETKLLRIKQVN